MLIELENLPQFVAAYRELCTYVDLIREKYPFIATCFQYPKISQFFSESIVFHGLQKGLILSDEGPFTELHLGGGADIIATKPNGQNLRIEVKGTGDKEFITVGDKDREADYLIWLLCAELKSDLPYPIATALLLKRPIEHLSDTKGRKTLNTLRKQWVGTIDKIIMPILTPEPIPTV